MGANHGAGVKALDPEACRSIVAWVSGNDKPNLDLPATRWVMCQQSDGVLWGYAAGDRWVMSTGHLGETRRASADPIELRLFGPDGEIMIWSAEASQRGRVCTDVPQTDSTRRPIDDHRIVAATKVINGDGTFTSVTETRGRTQVVPLNLDTPFEPWSLRLSCRHYLSDADDGRLIVTLSRLIDLEIKNEQL